MSISGSSSGATVFLVSDITPLTSDTDSSTTNPALVDKVAFGTGAQLRPEGTAFGTAPGANASIERKARAASTSATMGAGGVDEFAGNGEDSDNNAGDFVTRSASQPQNSSSTTERVQGVTIAESGGSTAVTEGGASDTYTLVLNSKPTADVTINITTDGQIAVSPNSLTFTSGNWNATQTVAVTAVDDGAVEGNHTSTISHSAASADSAYNGIAIAGITASIADNDVPGVTITETDGGTGVAEGGATDTYTVVLRTRPSADVVITILTDGQTTVSPSPLTFTNADWNVAQTVTVTAVDDAVAEDNHTSTLTHSAASGDAGYNGIAIQNIIANVADNDTASVSIAETGGSTNVTEGGATDTYTLVITSQPTADVVISITPDAQTTVAPSPLTFTAANWNTAQTVTVTAVDDAVVEGSHTSTLSHSVSSGDGKYNGIVIASLTAGVTDNDAANIVINEVVTDPQQDWNDSSGGNGVQFDATPGNGTVSETDEWIELYNAGAASVNLTNFTMQFTDGSPTSLAFSAPGSAVFVFSSGGSLTNFRPGEYLVVGNPDGAAGSLSNDIYITLRDGSNALIDDVEIGDDFEADGNGDGAPDGGSSDGNAGSAADESIARVPNGGDTNNDVNDFYKTVADIGAFNRGVLALGENGGGQAANAFDGAASVSNASLFRFKLTALGETVNVGSLTLTVAANGIASGDFANLQLIRDTNDNGAVDGGETAVGTVESPLDISDGLTISNLTISGVSSFILRGDVNNLSSSESLSLSLTAANLAGVTGGTSSKAIAPSGSVSPAGHFTAAAVGSVVINEVVVDPESDWSDSSGGNGVQFDGTPGSGTISDTDEYVELLINTSGLNLTGWTIELTDSSPQSGSLAAGGAFAVSRYVGAGTFNSTVAGDFLVLGNPNGSAMNNDIYLRLKDPTGAVIDDVEIGDDFEADGSGDGAPDGGSTNGSASGPSEESLSRLPNGRDTDNDINDFYRQLGTPGATNGGLITVGEHSAGQTANAFLDAFGLVPAIFSAPLYRFRLTAEGESVTVGALNFGFLTYDFMDGGLGNIELIQDTNANGVADAGEPAVGTVESPLVLTTNGLTISNIALPNSAAGLNFILRGTITGIDPGEWLTIWLDSTLVADALGSTTGKTVPATGQAGQLTHSDFRYSRDVLIHEVMPHPGQDYNHDGVIRATGDEYVELVNNNERPVHLGYWLLDDIPASGSTPFQIHIGTVIGARGLLVLLRDTTKLSLADDYDFVQLRDPHGELVDEVWWEKDPGEDYSISRLGEGRGPAAFGFDWLPTPGMFNQPRPLPKGAKPTPATAPLAAARTWDDGAWITITGRVVGPAPLFGARVIYVVDDSGAGIAVHLGAGAYPPMQAGQRVTAYGYLRHSLGERQLYVRNLFQFGLGPPGPQAVPVRIATGAVGEVTEGQLVTLIGRVVRLETNAVWLDDGSGRARVYFRTSLGFRRPRMRRGQVWQITGIVGEYTTSRSSAPGYRVLPRFESDVRQITGGGIEVAESPATPEDESDATDTPESELTPKPTVTATLDAAGTPNAVSPPIIAGQFVRVSGRVIPPLATWYRPPPLTISVPPK